MMNARTKWMMGFVQGERIRGNRATAHCDKGIHSFRLAAEFVTAGTACSLPYPCKNCGRTFLVTVACESVAMDDCTHAKATPVPCLDCGARVG